MVIKTPKNEDICRNMTKIYHDDIGLSQSLFTSHIFDLSGWGNGCIFKF